MAVEPARGVGAVPGALADRTVVQAVEVARRPRGVAERSGVSGAVRGVREVAGDGGAALAVVDGRWFQRAQPAEVSAGGPPSGGARRGGGGAPPRAAARAAGVGGAIAEVRSGEPAAPPSLDLPNAGQSGS